MLSGGRERVYWERMGWVKIGFHCHDVLPVNKVKKIETYSLGIIIV